MPKDKQQLIFNSKKFGGKKRKELHVWPRTEAGEQNSPKLSRRNQE